MKAHAILALSAAALAFGVERIEAQDVKYYEENGKTIRETRHVTQQPVTQLKTEAREHTYYRTVYNTEYQDHDRTVQVPITEYHWEPTLENRWNPFSQPYWTYKLVPKTRWEARVEKVKVPVSKAQVVPEKITHHVMVPTQEIQTQEVITRVAVHQPPAGGTVASSTGGQGPPAYGTRVSDSTASDIDWHKSDATSHR
jgi:hypothetical protein